MTYSVALAGKGGTGKTTLASLIIRFLSSEGKVPILAVDADPNANLAEGLGLEVKQTVGMMLATFIEEKFDFPQGMSKDAYIEYRLNELLVESEDVDLLVMGRGEGSGCYCYPNIVLRKYIDILTKNYSYVVLDNEAGMEHVSRRLSDHIDLMLLVSDYSIKGVRTAGRIRNLVEELKLEIGQQYFVINRTPEVLDTNLREEVERQRLNFLGMVPVDEKVYEYDLEGMPLINLPDNSKAVKTVNELMSKVILN
ncbi:MAG: carbon monoxide dehydrogenase [Deltaproteobacteria bacterium DG_8]|nr:MAG: carbon monoxide dehydrogenase [Deltaproteobacteria bacterium DG_8]